MVLDTFELEHSYIINSLIPFSYILNEGGVGFVGGGGGQAQQKQVNKWIHGFGPPY